MSKKLRCVRRVLGGLLGLGIAACGPEVPRRTGSPPPVNGAVSLSGIGGLVSIGVGDDSAITDIERAGSDALPGNGGTDSGGAAGEIPRGTEGAVSTRGGATAAGGSTALPGVPTDSSAGSAGAAETESAPPTLFFSEYVEGSSSNKALEISAQSRSVLLGCKVTAYFNGKSEAAVVATLSGVLEAGQVLTLCSSTLKDKLGSVCSQVGNLTFNGNDAVAINCNEQILDVIGQIGVDPGAAWGTGTNTTLDHTLRRNCGAESELPASPSFDPSGQWQAFPADTFDGLGLRGC